MLSRDEAEGSASREQVGIREDNREGISSLISTSTFGSLAILM
jgi:hypothetical protein